MPAALGRLGGDRQLGGFPGYRTVLVNRLNEQRRNHHAGLKAARLHLVRLLRRLRPPALVGSSLCALAKTPAKLRVLPCKNGRP